MNTYLLFKSIHLIAVISWMAGLLYLPRIFVYHSEATQNNLERVFWELLNYEILKQDRCLRRNKQIHFQISTLLFLFCKIYKDCLDLSYSSKRIIDFINFIITNSFFSLPIQFINS